MTESIAPGYFEVIDIPMDYSTVEKRVESNYYQDKDQVRLLHEIRFHLISTHHYHLADSTRMYVKCL